jgi:hypothetical protein
MSNRETSSNEILLSLPRSLKHNLQDTGLQLCHERNVIRRNSILSRSSRNDDLVHLGVGVDGFVGEVEVERHTGCSGCFGGEGTADGGVGGYTAKGSLHHFGTLYGCWSGWGVGLDRVLQFNRLSTVVSLKG